MIFGKILYNVPSVIFQNGLKFQNITTNHAITYTDTQEKLETIVMQNLGGGGVNKVHYGLRENGAFCGHFQQVAAAIF